MVKTGSKKGQMVDRVVIYSSLIAAVAVSLIIMAGGAFAAETVPRTGGTLRLVGELDAMGFDALESRASIGGGRIMANTVMEKLFSRNKQGELVPVLGLSATPSEDGKIWTVALRQGVKFHDGTPFNADAVVRHWQRLLDPANRYRGRIFIKPIQSVEKTGEFEVQFVLAHAWLPFTAALTSPSGFTALIPSPKAVEEGIQNRSPVGTGPFIFKEWKSHDRIVVTRNPNYWRKGKPYLDKIVFRPMPDHESRYAALVSGQTDVMVTDRPSHVKKLTKDPKFNKVLLNYRGAGILMLNNSRPPLDDPRVRQALAHAWDQKKYISASFKDIMPFTDHWFGDALNCGDLGYRHPDVEKAGELIAAYGKPVELEYVHTATVRGREAGIIIQQMMKAIGVKVNPVGADFPGIMKKLVTRNYDICSWVTAGAFDMGPRTFTLLHSESPWNMARYVNEEVDRLLVEQRMSTDPKHREEILCAIARKVNRDVPFLYLFGRLYYLFVHKDVHDLAISVMGEEGLELADIWMDR